MAKDYSQEKFETSRMKLFQIFLKTGKYRIVLSIFAGVIIFLSITSICMVIYKYRYNDFIVSEKEVNWFNNDIISAKSNIEYSGSLNLTTKSVNDFTSDFVKKIEALFPDLYVEKFSSAMSAQFFDYTGMPFIPWDFCEIMGIDYDVYANLSNCLVEGRMPLNESELLFYQNDIVEYSINDTINLYDRQSLSAPNRNYVIVGIIGENIERILQNNSVSADLFDWEFMIQSDYFEDYFAKALFLTNYTSFFEIMNRIFNYEGIFTYLVDAQYDLSNMNLNKLRDYARAFPSDEFLRYSSIVSNYVALGSDLKPFLIEYSNSWIDQFSRIIGINAPLFFILGLFSSIALTIGSRELAANFRKMKLYGLSYNTMRLFIFLENLIFTCISFIGGIAIGLLTGYLISRNIESISTTYYSYFIRDPLFLISIMIFLIGFLVLSFYIQNSIAKKTAKVEHEEFKKKRRLLKRLFSTNEFRLILTSLCFVLVSVVLFILYYYYGSKVHLLNTFSYHTLFWLMITCSLALVITFVFLLISRLLTFIWSLIGKWVWKNNLNTFSLSLKHISDSKKIYQITMLGSLIFGLIIIPGISTIISMPKHVEMEAKLAMGLSNLIIEDWEDPFDEMDIILENITEIVNYTEVVSYNIRNPNYGHYYPKPFEINILSIKNLDYFIATIDFDLLENTVEDLLALKTDSKILTDKKFAEDNNLTIVGSFDTERFSYYNIITLNFVNSFNFFPLTQLAKKTLFQNIEICSIVGSKQTITEFIGTLDVTSQMYAKTYKLIKAVNESSIPIIQRKLLDQNLYATTFEDYYNTYYSEIDVFQKGNLFFYLFLSIFTLVFVGYFTGNKILEDRMRTIESLYRLGAVKRQILGMFTLELFFVNLLPIIIALAISLPLIKYLIIYYLGLNENYIFFQSYLPIWLLTLIVIAGILISTFGWIIALIPKLYKYKPGKQE